ncbi:helicase [Bifidobacterium leontopitheci]|uniref:Helicase n=1 Tax=Bifidobacterium leontopitheci TaxID=2650774 RepID=A0A6I1GND8_9BIFI|nr:helicase [Bifidobacterium leontopitheci]KAB7790919.1 helicase [Bifidobacterium leontopitheci]
MSERTQQTNALESLRQWHERYRADLVPSALEDINQLGAKLDLTHAHPSGIAQLFAGGRASLDLLFRDNGMYRAANRRLERVLDDKAAKLRVSGVAELSLTVGVATWEGGAMPVLLYPVAVTSAKEEDGEAAVIRFVGHVRLNPAFVSVMREHDVEFDERELFNGANYESGTPETSAVFAAISKRAVTAFPDFTIERQIILGCFMSPDSLILAETQHVIDTLGQEEPTGNTVLDALAGNEDARKALKDENAPAFSPFDADPHNEFEIGDVDNEVRYAADMVASGRSIGVDVISGRDTADYAAAIASRCVMNGRSVLYVPCVADQKRRFRIAVNANELNGQVLDVADERCNANIDRQLIAAVSFQPGVASSRFDQIADELVGVRSRLTRYLGDLHCVDKTWGVSAYQTIQNLAQIATLPTHPATRVRLSPDTAREIGGHLDEWAGKLKRAGELGEYTLGPDDTAWYKASITSEDEAVAVYQRVVDLLRKLLPLTREQVASTVQTCGFPIPETAREWGRQVQVLKNLRRVLDVFQPEIFERDIDAMIESSKPKALRKKEGTTIGFWERRRHVKEAKSLLRVGAQVENLHDALQVVAKQAAQWRMFVPHGGWPVLPSKLDDIIATQEELARDLTALDAVLATTVQGGDLETLDFVHVEARLKALFDDHLALDTLPERCRLEQEFQTAGLSGLVDDLRSRRIDVGSVDGELQLAWWTTVFENIVRSSAIISNQDGSALQSAADRFVQVDVEHVRSVGPMVAQESMRRLCDMLFSRTQEANQLHTVLAGRTRVPLSRIRRDHAEILAAAKPIIMATPATLAALTEPTTLADVAIVDAAAHLPAVQLLTIICRARQVVVLAHRSTVTSPSVKELMDLLPVVKVRSHPVRRAPKLTSFLESHGYGEVRYDIATEPAQGRVAFHKVEANGTPVMATGLVESSQQEIDEVVRLITERASSFNIVPVGYILTVVTLTDVFRARLGAELKSLASRNASMGQFLRHVRIVGLPEVAGAQATDVILSLCYAKTVHGRLLQQFGVLERDGGRAMLLDALALADRHLDIVSAFSQADLDDERLHQAGPKLLHEMLRWVEALDDKSASQPVRPMSVTRGDNVLFNDLAERVRARGLNAAVNYGFERGMRIPMVVGLPDKPFSLAVLTDDAQFMSVQSTRERHRGLAQDLASLGWSVMTVWSVGAFVNPDKEVDQIVARIGEIYGDMR